MTIMRRTVSVSDGAGSRWPAGSVCLIVWAVLLGSPRVAAVAQAAPSNLGEALTQGLVEVEISGLGACSGDAILAEVANKSDDYLLLTVPAGTVLRPGNSKYQRMIVDRVKGRLAGDDTYEPTPSIALGPRQRQTFVISAYCLDFDRENPSRKTSFTPSPVDVKGKAVLEAGTAADLSVPAIQAAIWMKLGKVSSDQIRKRIRVSAAELEAARRLSVERTYGTRPQSPAASAPMPAPLPSVTGLPPNLPPALPPRLPSLPPVLDLPPKLPPLEPPQLPSLPPPVPKLPPDMPLAPPINLDPKVWRTPEPPERPQAADLWVNPKDGMDMVYVGGGEFVPGWRDGEWCRLSLEGYWIGRTEVTNAQYHRFVEATGHRPPSHWKKGAVPQGMEESPVVSVTWEDASAYCEWAGGRLPSELEWQKAARGLDARTFPWGETWDSARSRNFMLVTGRSYPNMDEYLSALREWDRLHDGVREGPSAVGSYSSGASPYGCYDMAGNVWEWCADWYEKAAYNRYLDGDLNPPSSGTARVVRGGSWRDGVRFFSQTDWRDRLRPDSRMIDLGFRCARDAAP